MQTEMEMVPTNSEIDENTEKIDSGSDNESDDGHGHGNTSSHAGSMSLSETLSNLVTSEEMYPWVKVFLVAVIIGVVEYIPATSLALTLPAKLKTLDKIMYSHGLAAMTFTNVAFAAGLVGFAALCVTLIAPSAGGSGVPQIIVYLSNGQMNDPELLSPKTVIIKMIGVTSAITGGLVIGREGPAIHIGAAIGYLAHDGLGQIQEWWTNVPQLYDGYMVHNIIMAGAASGFAAAFRAPIGGLLYCTEEIATHWDIKEHMNVGAQMFVSVAVCAFVTQTIMVLTSDTGVISFSSVVIFDSEGASENAGSIWHYEDIPGFIITAMICGVIGGLVTKYSIKMVEFRRSIKWSKPWLGKTCDAVGVAVLTALVFSLIPSLYPDCIHIPYVNDYGGRRRLGGAGGDRRYCQYTCEDEFYSELASLTLAGEENVIRHLMSRDSTEFHFASMFIFLIFYTPLLILAMGLAVPAGTFVPNLLLGSLIGRICGEVMQEVYAHDLTLISLPGVYALIGASSMLGAWTRTMIAVVITLVEITGDVGLATPLIVTCVISRALSTKIEHHSYAHSIFYDIMKSMGKGESAVHPNDWLETDIGMEKDDKDKNAKGRRKSATKRPSIELMDPQAHPINGDEIEIITD